MSSSSSSCTVSEDVCMSGASEEDIKACIMDDESQWLAWLEDLAHHVEGAAVATGDPPMVKNWVVEAIQQPPAERSKYRDDYEVALFRPCILYSIHRAIVKARHCFGTPTENSDASSLSGSATGELVEASDQKLGTPPSYSCHPLNDEDDHLPAADASKPSQEWDCLMQMMPERSSEAEEWLPWKEALRDGLNEEGPEADGLAHAPRVRSLINLCGLGDLWCAAWRRILMDDLVTPMVALGCRKDFNVAVLSPLLRYFSTIIPELIEPAGVASFASGCGSWKAMVCWTMARLRCRGPGNSNGRNSIIDRRDRGIFAMIRDYPYSTQALIDLSWCIEYLEACKEKGFEVGDSPSLMVQLAASIQLEFHRRLLIPSAHTSDVLKLYLRTFNSVNVLLGGDRPEAARKIFDWICEPVVAFLQGRSDTVRCVVAAMLEGGSENGWDEDSKPKGIYPGQLRRDHGPGVPVARLKRYSASGEWLELYNFETPVMPATAQQGSVRLSSPPLVSAAGGRFIQVWDESGRARSFLDTCRSARFPPASQRGKIESTEAQMLPLLVVGVYGSEDIFIREYRELMCQRLLGVSYASNSQAESTRDANNLITLKKKFGKDALQPCDKASVPSYNGYDVFVFWTAGQLNALSWLRLSFTTLRTRR
ncbi:Anaphase-promoting complex subunit 2, partial [Perkinsus olseni]